ncbi:hybrid sensor histidine kinase/response regulator [Pelobacter propionicus]|uniref:histidine kinase n=1 Tax=Pelobacter propionicus (strain DSM 2379 / NBRC 103807 / OttBd1) TaxID=338966 RepID=A1AT95_PELPD|nr:hybrid sensor histidine kinase/response regulator [Pelobacter propionicus]ABL00566.1 response regulator receiver sensor signal transduction histidine kinase [Pelobacter propionicus DSM 2379]
MSPQTPQRVLIVDDEMLVAKILSLHLEESGYLTEWAKDGEQCLALLAEKTYALVLLDIWMPQMSGVQVLEQIRESGNDVAVIMMSGHGSESMAVNCMKNGAMDYFAKPFEFNDVLQRVDQAIANRAMRLEKQRLEREKDDFVSMLSHDMKNPITAVIGSIDIMREGCLGPVDQEQSEYLQSAIDSCNEVVAMIDNLLDIHRFEAGRMRLDLQPSDPRELLSAIVGRFGMLAGREGVVLNVDVDPDLPWLAVDRSAFSRTVTNLLSNALKFTLEGGMITLSCHSLDTKRAMELPVPAYAAQQASLLFNGHGHLVRLSVRDTGSGIPPEDQERIFERFVQSSQGGKGRSGAGLGLAYCTLTVKGFGGVIWVESTPEQGSEFIILLPALEECDGA